MQNVMSSQKFSRRYSVRASITLWMVIAGFFWVTLGLALTYVAHWGDDPMTAEARRLSTIVPAAGPAMAPDPARKTQD